MLFTARSPAGPTAGGTSGPAARAAAADNYKPDLTAPGHALRVIRSKAATGGGDPVVTPRSGTSLAAPFVAGTIACLYEVAPEGRARPGADCGDAAARRRPRRNPPAAGWEPQFGHGLLNPRGGEPGCDRSPRREVRAGTPPAAAWGRIRMNPAFTFARRRRQSGLIRATPIRAPRAPDEDDARDHRTVQPRLPALLRPLQGGKPRPELSIDDWRRVVDELAETGVMWLYIEGGEPFLKEGFVDLLAENTPRMFTMVRTHGNADDAALAARLKAIDVAIVLVDLWGAESRNARRADRHARQLRTFGARHPPPRRGRDRHPDAVHPQPPQRGRTRRLCGAGGRAWAPARSASCGCTRWAVRQAWSELALSLER